MLSPSDFNNAVPQFTNGNYASNPINPQYIAEPDAVSYNRGTEPLQTLPAQWWNWFLNKFTGRFNKVNIYVKNIFNELAQVLSIFNITPDGTEQTPTTSQLKTVFECCYPEYVKTTASLVGTETTVNGHPLSSNVTVTRSDLGLGTSATVNTGTAVGCIPTVGTALGTTNNNILVTDASGNLKPSGITVGTAAGCDASAFRASTWTPTLVECANKGKNGSLYSAFGSNAFNSTAFTTCTGTVTQVKIGSTAYNPSSGVISLPAYPSIPTCVACAGAISRTGYTTAYDFDVALTNNSTTADGTTLYVSNTCRLKYCNTTGVLKSVAFCGAVYGCACCAGRDGSGCAFGTAARYACGCFRPSTWTPSCVSRSHCSDYSEFAYIWRPIFYSTDTTTINYCCVCLWNSDSYGTMCLCNKSNCGVLVSFFHCFNNVFCADMKLIPPHAVADLGICWNCGSGLENRCICVYMFK